MSTSDVFTPDDVARAHAYHRPLYVALLVDTALTAGLWLAAWRLLHPFRGLGWAAATAAYAAALAVALNVLLLPISLWSGFVRERRWGFSTQRLGGWLADRSKGLVVGVALQTATLLGLVALAHALPRRWPLVAAPAAALLVLLLAFVAPIVLEPLFNRFAPLADEAFAADLRALAERAAVPVRDVLVADASRRTRKTNAYVSGLGRTRRVVLYDTLLESSGKDETRVVVAHELGHRRQRHVAKGTLLGMAAAAVAVVAVWAVVRHAGDLRNLPLVLLVGLGLQAVAAPAGAWISRRWERAADRFSLDVTRDPDAYERAFVRLARSNLSDLDPPRLVYALLFTHPTPSERVAAARAWVGGAQRQPLDVAG